MKQYGFFFNADDCVGCHTCQVACKDTHDLPVGVNYRTVRTFICGSGYTPRLYHLSVACNHCSNPSCMAACEPGALIRDTYGLVQLNAEVCNGCEKCLSACPYGALGVLAGKAVKCDGCAALRANGEGVPCVVSCPQRALEFGSMAELEAAHAKQKLSADAAPLPSSALTSPNLLIFAKDCMDDTDFDEIVI